MFALVDCNNFYASCERVFNPKLKYQPVVVLSNNDGCVIARSNEAKALNIAMGAPYFQIEAFCRQHRVHVCSSNYALYGDLSRRVMDILQAQVEQVEEYSIDEAFLQFHKVTQPQDLLAIARQLRRMILQWTGIPVSIGIAPTKVLAKVANHIAKKQTQQHVFGLFDKETERRILSSFAVEDLWGVGRQWAQRLQQQNVLTAWELRQLPPKRLRQSFNVVMERLVTELRGVSCLPLEEMAPRQQIVVSRSFGKQVAELDELREAASCYAVRACEKLRRQGSKAGAVELFLMTNAFSENPYYANSVHHPFVIPTDDTRQILAFVEQGLSKIYRAGFSYKKVGVRLFKLNEGEQQQGDLWSRPSPEDSNRAAELMSVVDEINQTLGKNRVFYAAQGVERDWQMKRQFCSPSYTTNWQELLKVK